MQAFIPSPLLKVKYGHYSLGREKVHYSHLVDFKADYWPLPVTRVEQVYQILTALSRNGRH